MAIQSRQVSTPHLPLQICNMYGHISINTLVDVVSTCDVIHNHIIGVDPNDLIMQDETCETESSDRG